MVKILVTRVNIPYFCSIKLKNVGYIAIITSLVLLAFHSFSYRCTIRGICEINHTIEDSAIKKYYYPPKNRYKGTVACSIPVTPAIPNFFVNNWKKTVQDCSHERKLVFLETETTLTFLPKVQLPCCIQEITRGRNDADSGLAECEYVDNNAERVNATTKEAFFIKCGGYTSAEATIPIQPNVQEKIHFWGKVPLDKRPPSIFIFGLDSVSRAHAYRSLPQSINRMMKLGFVDFRSYHSVKDMTWPNFLALLMGLTVDEMKDSYAADRSLPHDSFPFIWKQYAQRNYVTSFIEDFPQTFEWNGQGGFNEKPTDYYLYHLFQELARARKGLLTLLAHQRDCASTETVPEFILRYTTRFLQKFAKIPFFSFTWLNYPFHDDIYALPDLDQHLVQFFNMVSSNNDILRNTIIIFLSDHGDRISDFSRNSPISYLERSLPPLFIRLPDRFRKLHPEITKTLYANSDKLTTPFDLHQTLLHLLNISSHPDSMIHNFSEKQDRSSLFKPFALNRTCGSTNIPPYLCLCNVNYYDFLNTEITADFTKQALVATKELLNAKINSSKYRGKCAQLDFLIVGNGMDPNGFHKIISQSTEFIDSVVSVMLSPGGASFEVRLRTPHGKGGNDFSSKASKLIGFTRTNPYANQSWCVTGNTNEDKKMKELCYCK